MDQMFLNYLRDQQQQQSQPSQGGAPMPMPQPNLGSQNPGLPKEINNPFDAGIKRAKESARQSLGMTDDQKDKALRRSALTFAGNMSQQPKVRGMLANFASVGNALNPAIMEHDRFEDEAIGQNNALANQILAHNNADQDRAAAMEERDWRRGHAEDVLNEQRRYHDQMAQMRNNDMNLVPFEGREFARLDSVERRKARDAKTLIAPNVVALRSVLHAWNNLKKFTQDDTVKPIGGYAPLINPLKDMLGRYGSMKDLKKATSLREKLDAELSNLTTALENVKRGGKGSLGYGMYKVLKPNFPNVKKDDDATFDEKMASMTKEVNLYYNAAKLRAQLGIDIDAADLEAMQAKEDTQPQSNTPPNPNQENDQTDVDSGTEVPQSNEVEMYNAKTNETHIVPATEENIQLYRNSGFEIVS